MKEWFEYSNGYVNLDNENIYFTNTGNWSETKDLKEKGIQKQNSFRKFRIVFFIGIIGLLFGFLFFKNLLNSNKSLLAILGLPITFYFFYNYLKRETGSKFKLPILKISTIEFDRKTAIINFRDSGNKEDDIVLYGISEKGKALLIDLKK